MATTCRRPIQSWLRGAWGLLVVLLLAPASAHAGCGDYVVLDGRGVHPAATPSHSPLPRPALPAPCTGPTCTRHVPLSLPVSATPTGPVAGEHWGRLVDPGDGADPCLRWSLVEEPCARPPHHGPSIFHPPR